MNITISITLGIIFVALLAALVGTFARWVAQKANLAEWATFAVGLFFAFLILLALKA